MWRIQIENRKEKSELDILCDKRNHTIYVISEIHKRMEETQETMDFWIKRLDEEIEILENLNKKIERF